jgi:hypothetical protein
LFLDGVRLGAVPNFIKGLLFQVPHDPGLLGAAARQDTAIGVQKEQLGARAAGDGTAPPLKVLEKAEIDKSPAPILET